MLHSTITKKGQTTIPNEIRVALNIHPGDRLEYKLEGKSVSMQVHPGTRSLAGTLASTKNYHVKLNNKRTELAQQVRSVSDKGLQNIRQAIHDAFQTIQSEREKYME